MKTHRIIKQVLSVNYAFFWAGGIISYVFLGEPPLNSRWAAPVFLYLAGALTIELTSSGYRIRLMACGILGMVSEISSVWLGFPFGSYAYTDVLKPFLLGVPLAIGFAWLILFAYVKHMLESFSIQKPWFIICGAIWMVGLDLLIDPLASGPLGYWIWYDKGWYCGVPMVNFMGWLCVSLILFIVFRAPWPPSEGVNQIGLSIVLFFSLIALARGILPSLTTGIILISIHFWMLWRMRLQQNRF
ncbi:MAG: carotenoid biosynthesis protein [Thermodesulfobacteriota bacterium]|nr:carotenoid biosynthesis protein [Thermodesulfobacteriota bacterium]